MTTRTVLSLPVELQIQILSHLPWQSHFLISTVCPLWDSILKTATFRLKRYIKRLFPHPDTEPALVHRILGQDVMVLEIYRKGGVNTLIRTPPENNSATANKIEKSEENGIEAKEKEERKGKDKEEPKDRRTIVCSRKEWPDKDGHSHLDTCLVITNPETDEEVFITNPIILDITASSLLNFDTMVWDDPKDSKITPKQSNIIMKDGKIDDRRFKFFFYELACDKNLVHDPPMHQSFEEFWDDSSCSLQKMLDGLEQYIQEQVFKKCDDVDTVWLIFRRDPYNETIESWHAATVVSHDMEGEPDRLW